MSILAEGLRNQFNLPPVWTELEGKQVCRSPDLAKKEFAADYPFFFLPVFLLNFIIFLVYT